VYEATDSTGIARALAMKQRPRLLKLDGIVARRRLIGMLLRRGFDYDLIRPVVDEVLGQEAIPE
jgi:SOS response regulatory protein OraA/RecX